MKIVNVGVTDKDSDIVLLDDPKPDCIVLVIEKEEGETSKDVIDKIKTLQRG